MINPLYLDNSFAPSFASSFRSRLTATHSGASVDSSVFPVAIWPDFLDAQMCVSLRDELAGMTFAQRSSDLYEFHQTTDLKHLSPASHPLISQLCSELYSPQFLGVMEQVTGRKLGGHVDISGQRYQQGDFLLCHDDRLERRRIALILYLVQEEGESVLQGGRLFAMRSDEEGRPVMDNPATVTPKWNTLAFFEVTRFSFHQVEQVYSSNVPRYSVTCWFHDRDGDEAIAKSTYRDQSTDKTKATEHTLAGEHIMPQSANIAMQAIPLDLILPIKFACPFPLGSLLSDLDRLAVPLHRPHFHGLVLSSAQLSSCPDWMASLLHDSFHRQLEGMTGWNLDWMTKPVAWCLASSDHFIRFDRQIDRQQDVEYNYKERSVSVAPLTAKLHLSLVIRFCKNSSTTMKPFFKLHFEPLRIKKLPKKFSKLIIVTVKFNKSSNNDRS